MSDSPEGMELHPEGYRPTGDGPQPVPPGKLPPSAGPYLHHVEIDEEGITSGLLSHPDVAHMGESRPGRETHNLARYGAESPKHHYCYSLPGVSIREIARIWNVNPGTLANWCSRNRWNQIRQQYLKTRSLTEGGLAVGSSDEANREIILAKQRGYLAEAMEIAMDRLRNPQEEYPFPTGGTAFIEKTAMSFAKELASLKAVWEMQRVTEGWATKLTASVQHHTSERPPVTESFIHAESGAEMPMDYEPEIDPPALGQAVDDVVIDLGDEPILEGETYDPGEFE